MEESIKRQLAFIGEDPEREGLLETPARILKSWGTLYAGYKQNPADIFTVFASEGFDQMVLLKDIEMYSMCEHHMLPFFGKAHVAYLPGDTVVGISKLARLVDIYARRLQIQERLGEQITMALMHYLHPKGAACVIEAQHMCMRMRGVSKQNSIMVTSSLKGEFLTDPTLRAEFMTLIK
jgi:GTP cyclohydrolase I